MPTVSIIMPVYNAEKYVAQAVESVLKQSFSDFEFLIFDDGCTDKSIEIIQQFKDKRIQIFSDGKNSGIVKRLNFLIKKSTGQYIARMDADDIWYPEKLEKQILFLSNHHNVMMVACFAEFIDENNLKAKINFKQYYLFKDIKKHLPNHNFIIHSSVVFKKNVFNIIGLYRDKYLHAEDYDMWLRFLKQNIPFSILNKTLIKYRFSNQSINHKYSKEQNKNVIKLKLNFYKSHHFHWFYIKELIKNIFYWLFH